MNAPLKHPLAADKPQAELRSSKAPGPTPNPAAEAEDETASTSTPENTSVPPTYGSASSRSAGVYSLEELLKVISERYTQARNNEADINAFLEALHAKNNPAKFLKEEIFAGSTPKKDIADLVYSLRANGGFLQEGYYVPRATQAAIDISKDKISFHGAVAKGSTPEKPLREKMTFTDALHMMALASINPTMLPPNKIHIDHANRAERILLIEAAKRINSMLPADQQLNVVSTIIERNFNFKSGREFDAAFNAFVAKQDSPLSPAPINAVFEDDGIMELGDAAFVQEEPQAATPSADASTASAEPVMDDFADELDKAPDEGITQPVVTDPLSALTSLINSEEAKDILNNSVPVGRTDEENTRNIHKLSFSESEGMENAILAALNSDGTYEPVAKIEKGETVQVTKTSVIMGETVMEEFDPQVHLQGMKAALEAAAKENFDAWFKDKESEYKTAESAPRTAFPMQISAGSKDAAYFVVDGDNTPKIIRMETEFGDYRDSEIYLQSDFDHPLHPAYWDSLLSTAKPIRETQNEANRAAKEVLEGTAESVQITKDLEIDAKDFSASYKILQEYKNYNDTLRNKFGYIASGALETKTKSLAGQDFTVSSAQLSLKEMKSASKTEVENQRKLNRKYTAPSAPSVDI